KFTAGNITTLFILVFGFVISTATLAYLFIFPSFLILRYKYPHVPRTYRVPGGMPVAWIVTVLPFAYAAFTVFFILVPATTSVDRLTYELTQFIPWFSLSCSPLSSTSWGTMISVTRMC